MNERLTLANADEAIRSAGKEFVELFHHGSLAVEFYRPKKVDRQQPHTRDEVYVVASGSGFFNCGGRRQPFQAGEVLFAAAGVEHRFEEFSDDFATWVFFYGPEGGEAKAP
jgi:mannose-6-phosphate isomerase-like protein (cupin superfamily)